MKEEISENKENPLTKSDFKAKEALKVEYLIGTLVIGIILGLVTSYLGISTTLGALSVPVAIAGIVILIKNPVLSFFNSRCFPNNICTLQLNIYFLYFLYKTYLNRKKQYYKNYILLKN